MTITVNLVDDFGAVGDGVTDDSGAFLAFHTWALSFANEHIILVVPPLNFLVPYGGGAGGYNGLIFTENLRHVTISATGATIQKMAWTPDLYGFMYQFSDPEPYSYSARIATCGAGSTAVRLLDSSLSGRFTVGYWVAVTCLEMQGPIGSPPSWYHFDYKQITRIDSVNGIIYLSEPLNYGYRSTYPDYSHVDYDTNLGGAATIHAYKPAFNIEYELIGAAVPSPGQGQINGGGRIITITDCDLTGVDSAPSTSLVWTHDGGTVDGFEFDKDIDTLIVNNMTVTDYSVFQSASIRIFNSDNCIWNVLQGTPQHATITNSSFTSLSVGPATYGYAKSVTIDNCTVSAFGGEMQQLNLAAWTFDNGVFTSPINVFEPPHFAVPGCRLVWSDGTNKFYGYAGTVTDIYRDTTTIYIETDLTVIPSLPVTVGNLSPHPCIDITVTNSTGCADIENLSQAPANAPVFQYVNYTITGDAVPAFVPPLPTANRIWGELVTLRINVLQAYTGALANLSLNIGGPSSAFVVYLNAPTVVGGYAAIVDCKATGLREITTTIVTGAAAGDSIPAAQAMRFIDSIAPTFSADISAESSSVWPIINIELVTDQGIDTTLWDEGLVPYHGIAGGALALE